MLTQILNSTSRSTTQRHQQMMFILVTRSIFIELILMVVMDLNMSWLVMLLSVLMMSMAELKYMILKKVHCRAVRRSRSSGIFCRSWSRSWKTPADKIMKNYFIFQWTFGNGKLSWMIWSYYKVSLLAPIRFVASKILQAHLLSLLIQKSTDPDAFWAKIPRCHAVLLSTKHCFKQAPKHVYLISKGESSKRYKIHSETNWNTFAGFYF
jgi:hypothetical protein